ncbi:doublesex- and mab-3-related transcription factor 1Y isoform X1 [Fundulus heteroclitus]|uniref:doublesex- and mab-3-related transcription factor 1Y isoform X1 n=1 Tax=Fundulus heteroclitus TaxID=8078 RepID=UPI00165AC2A1|nr:doublesex- and mab-3-related transcription factor 1Y isoform X1 [Fundulus heteroclitus]
MSEPRQPKCSRCRNHGVFTRKKGHSRCPFSGCECWKCGLLTQRTQVSALHRNLDRARNHKTGPEPPRPGPGPAAGPGASAGALDPERMGTEARSRRTEPGGEPGSDSRDVPSCLVHVGDSGQPVPPPPPPPPHLQLLSPTFSSSSLPSPPDLLLYLPCLPPGHAGLYEGLCRPLMLQEVTHYPALPAEDCRMIFFPFHLPPPPPPDGFLDASSAASAYRYGP